MGTVTRIRDNLINFVTGLGTIKDPTTSAQHNLVLLNRAQLDIAYRSNWLAKRIVNAPAEDATREWRSWQAANKQIEALEDAEREFDLQRKTKQTLIRSRLYGGAAFILGVDSGMPEEPLLIEKVGKGDLKFIVGVSMHDLAAGPINWDVMSPWYARPEYYTVASRIQNIDNNLNSIVRIHPSRVITFVGNELPDPTISPMGPEWGDSVLIDCDEVIKDFGMVVGGLANMVNDAKLDVIKIPDFSKNIATAEYANRLFSRFTMANQAKSSINSLLLDSEEEWNRISTSFASLPQLLNEFLTVTSGAAGIPVSRLMGQAPGKSLGGSTSGGEQDMKNYYDTITAMQKTMIGPTMEFLDNILMAHCFGAVDPVIFYEWSPLYTPDPAQLATIALAKAQASQLDVTMALINPDALRRARINQLVEDGTYPGLEDAIDEFGEDPPEPKPDPNYDPNAPKPKPGDPKAKPEPDKGGGGGGNTLNIVHSITKDYNPNHEPAGTSVGGQFSSGDSLSETKDAQGFIDARNASTRSKFMTPLVPDDLNDHRLFLSNNGKVGYALSPEGDLQNLFSNSSTKGAGKKALVDAIKNGAQTLDCYSGYLTDVYSAHGFEAVSRIKFDPQYAPEGWDSDPDLKHQPDVVFMRYRGGDRATISNHVGKFKPYDQSSVKLYPDYDSAKAAQGRTVMDQQSLGSRAGRDGEHDQTGWGGILHTRLGRFSGSVSGRPRLLDFNPNHDPKNGQFASLGGNQGHPATVSSRVISAKGRTEAERAHYDNLRTQYQRADLQAAMQDPASFAYNVDLLTNAQTYPQFKASELTGDTRSKAEAVIGRMVSNLLFLYNYVPEGKTPEETEANKKAWEAKRQASKFWYEGAHDMADNLSKQYKYPFPSVVGAVAALSPNKDWNENAYIAEAVVRIYATQQNTKWDAAMDDTANTIWSTQANKVLAEAIRGKTLAECNGSAEKGAWIRTYDEAHTDHTYHKINVDGTQGEIKRNGKNEDGDPSKIRWQTVDMIAAAIESLDSGGDHKKIGEAISQMHKVRSFYNNILDPNSKNEDVTIDTHAAGAALLAPHGGLTTAINQMFGKSPQKDKQAPDWKATKNPNSTGSQGLYPIYAEAYRRAAKEVHLQPRQFQSIVWVHKIDLFGNSSPVRNAKIDAVWRRFHAGQLSLEDAQKGVMTEAINHGKDE